MKTKIKNRILLLLVLLTAVSSYSHAQLRVSNFTSFGSTANGSAFLDASSNDPYNVTANIGKGLVFPQVDLSTFTFSPASGFTPTNNYPTRFDGMIVYNTKEGGTALSGSATQGTLTRGFWYYDNRAPYAANANGGTWRPLGGSFDPKVMPSGSWIYCPPFMLPWTAGATGQKVNLFSKYTDGLSGYTASGSNVKKTTGAAAVANLVSSASDFEYLVRYETGHPATGSITITGINATTGEMTYDCSSTAPDCTDFVSVVLIKK